MKQHVGITNPFGRTKRIIVGIINGATIPELDISVYATMPEKQLGFFKENGGSPFPSRYIEQADQELQFFTEVLKDNNVIVDRPKFIDFSQPIITPYWTTKGGLYAAMPRDILLVIGNKIIVAPMSWRCRQREAEAYSELLNEYGTMGYEIIHAPKPLLKDELYKKLIKTETTGFISILNEHEPVFDAADFIVLEKIILAQKSHVTNQAGIDWLRKIVGGSHEIFVVKPNDDKPMHIDATIVPLREGLMLVNPERIDIKILRSELPKDLKKWKFIEAPYPVVNETDPPKYMTSDWLSINIITLDSNTAIVEESQENLIKLLEKHNFIVIKMPFKNFQCFGGSFHCATQEIDKE